MQTPSFQVKSVKLLRETKLSVLKQRPFDRHMLQDGQHREGSKPEHGLSSLAVEPFGR